MGGENTQIKIAITDKMCYGNGRRKADTRGTERVRRLVMLLITKTSEGGWAVGTEQRSLVRSDGHIVTLLQR